MNQSGANMRQNKSSKDSKIELSPAPDTASLNVIDTPIEVKAEFDKKYDSIDTLAEEEDARLENDDPIDTPEEVAEIMTENPVRQDVKEQLKKILESQEQEAEPEPEPEPDQVQSSWNQL